MAKRPALIVFARAPAAGRTKTRLIPALGPAGAAAIYRCFLLDTLSHLGDLPADVTIAAAEPEDVEPLAALVAEVGLQASLTVQRGDELGPRIAEAMRDALRAGRPAAVVIGSDAPDLPPALIAEGLELTRHRDLVLGPCRDGGYYLIGLCAATFSDRTAAGRPAPPFPSLFAGVRWSSETVLADTLRAAETAGLSVGLLEPWYDVDTPADLDLLRDRVAKQVLTTKLIPCRRTWDYLCDLPERE